MYVLFVFLTVFWAPTSWSAGFDFSMASGGETTGEFRFPPSIGEGRYVVDEPEGVAIYRTEASSPYLKGVPGYPMGSAAIFEDSKCVVWDQKILENDSLFLCVLTQKGESFCVIRRILIKASLAGVRFYFEFSKNPGYVLDIFEAYKLTKHEKGFYTALVTKSAMIEAINTMPFFTSVSYDVLLHAVLASEHLQSAFDNSRRFKHISLPVVGHRMPIHGSVDVDGPPDRLSIEDLNAQDRNLLPVIGKGFFAMVFASDAGERLQKFSEFLSREGGP